ncbi:MAG: methionyl-tRNA formyltransferase [Candidatus Didemnitutus sp.]|nr:methionyl-tRNA formyltransferase [Candidatus Didemnitutus sp.]
MLRIVFMGSDEIALPALNWLAGEESGPVRLVAVFTQPDRAVGRGQQVQPNAIKVWAQAHGLPVHQPEKFSDESRALLASYATDLSLVMAYGHILRQPVIETPRLGTVNLHASLLPKFRGASPIQTAVARGEKETGVALMRMVLALDAGPVGDVERVPIAPLDTAKEIEQKIAAACVPLLRRSLPRIAEGTMEFVDQDHAGATYCRRLEKSDGAVDFARPAEELAAHINGLMPWPGCTTEINGLTIKLGLADVWRATEGGTFAPVGLTPGTVVGDEADGLLVATGEGILRLRRLQRPGGKMLSAAEFGRGMPVSAGTRLPSRPLPTLEAAHPFPRPKN